MTILLGDVNAKHNNWCSDDKPTQEGRKIDNVASQFLLSQIIKEPTHISQSFSSCINLLFTNQPILVTDSGVHLSLHSNCHHQIIYAKFNLKIIYPPPYERHIWHYNHAKPESIQRALEVFNWRRASGGKTINEKVSILTNTIINIKSNYVPSEVVTVDDRDPPWINDKIKNFIQTKKRLYKNYLKKIIMYSKNF